MRSRYTLPLILVVVFVFAVGMLFKGPFSRLTAGSVPRVPCCPSPANNATNTMPTVLNWADTSGASAHDVYMDDSTPPKLRATVTQSQWTIAGGAVPVAGHTYNWKIVAKNAAGSTTGPTWRFGAGKAAPPPPPPPASVLGTPCCPSPANNAVNVSNSTTLLDWADRPGSISYDVYFTEYPAGKDPIYHSTFSLATSQWTIPASLRPLKPGTFYQWQLRAKTAAAVNVTLSPIWAFTTAYEEVLSPGAVQTVYRGGVPHTDKNGNARDSYTSTSFFPRCIYDAIPGSFQAIKDGGFNCVHTYEQYGISDRIAELRTNGLQLFKHWPTDAEIRSHKSDPNILGWYLDEEATHQTFLEMASTGDTTLMNKRYQAYLSRKAAIKAIDPRHPVLPLDSGWIPPGYQSWWEKWNTSGDVTAYDHYPLESGTPDIKVLADRLSLATKITGEEKPIWLTVQAYSGNAAVLPTPTEFRGMVFTSIIHGATGIISFAYDSWVTRAWWVVGIAPNPAIQYGDYPPATAAQVSQSKALWKGETVLNAELNRLMPQILSPTANVSYSVYFSGPNKTQTPIRTMLKLRNGVYTLFVSNIERTSLGARFQFPNNIVSVKRINQNGSVTPITPRGSAFRDSLGPFGVGIYEIRF